MRVNELMIYKNIEEGEVLQDMAFLMENYDSDFYNQEDLKGLLFDTANQILELAVSHGFEGNLWHTYLTFLLANHENAYSTSCEIVGEIQGTINEAALHDFQIFKELFDYDFREMEEKLGADCISMLSRLSGDEGIWKSLQPEDPGPDLRAGGPSCRGGDGGGFQGYPDPVLQGIWSGEIWPSQGVSC